MTVTLRTANDKRLIAQDADLIIHVFLDAARQLAKGTPVATLHADLNREARTASDSMREVLGAVMANLDDEAPLVALIVVAHWVFKQFLDAQHRHHEDVMALVLGQRLFAGETGAQQAA